MILNSEHLWHMYRPFFTPKLIHFLWGHWLGVADTTQGYVRSTGEGLGPRTAPLQKPAADRLPDYPHFSPAHLKLGVPTNPLKFDNFWKGPQNWEKHFITLPGLSQRMGGRNTRRKRRMGTGVGVWCPLPCPPWAHCHLSTPVFTHLEAPWTCHLGVSGQVSVCRQDWLQHCPLEFRGTGHPNPPALPWWFWWATPPETVQGPTKSLQIRTRGASVTQKSQGTWKLCVKPGQILSTLFLLYHHDLMI